MRQVLRLTFRMLKIVLLLIISLEILSFLAITISNYILYGHAREGSRAVYDGYTLFLQTSGVRPTTNNEKFPDPKRNKIIWFFGGSTMRGSTEDDGKTIPSLVARYLNSWDQDHRYTCVNFGTNSFNSLLETKYLVKQLVENPDKPDMVIFYDGANDPKYFAEHQSPYGHHGYRRVKALIESYYAGWYGIFKPIHAAVNASFTRELYDKIHQIFIPIQVSSEALEQFVNLSEKRYDFVNKLAGCYDAEFLLMWQPTIYVENCEIPESVKRAEKSPLVDSSKLDTMRNNFARPYNSIEERLKSKPYFVTLRNSLCDRTEAAYQPDGVHLTDNGRQMAAGKIAKKIIERTVAEGTKN